ncbi:MAG: hypothetical protein EXR61_03510 [Chloroflexi bacterium]|nr:hypothetical protein [Chloroflexota bacterium]
MQISQLREHTERVKPPRALFVPFPFGRALGRPNDPPLQLRVLRAALALFSMPGAPLIVDLEGDDPYVGQSLDLPQASSVDSPVAPPRPADELTSLRRSYEAFVLAHGGRTAVGFTGVPQRRFRALVRFLEAYAEGDGSADVAERPADVSVPRFLRLAADDLKAFYLEARLHDHPSEPFGDPDRWLWGATALGVLLRRVRDRLKASGDPVLEALAFGIAR